MPGIKSTNDELADRIEFTLTLVGRRVYKGEIKRVLAERYNVCSRTAETYISRAKELLTRLTNLSREEHVERSLGFYESVVAGDGHTTPDRLKAQERIDTLLGLCPQGQQSAGGVSVLVVLGPDGTEPRQVTAEPGTNGDTPHVLGPGDEPC